MLSYRLAVVVASQMMRGHAGPKHFYRAMHYSAKRYLAIACRLSVCL